MRVEFWLRNELVTPAILRDRWFLPLSAWLATVAGIGRLPAIGANAASVVTVLAVFACTTFTTPALAATAIAVAATILCLIVERGAERYFLSDDAREFVLDEVAGMAVALAFLPAHPNPWLYPVALIAFRFFDILKPGIKWVERLPIRGKVAWDDVLAGLYAGIVTLLVSLLTGN